MGIVDDFCHSLCFFYTYSNRCCRKQLFMAREKHEKYFENFVE